MPISTNNSIRTLEVVEDARVDLTLPQLEVLVDRHFEAFQTFGRRTVEEAWQAGCYLRQAKALVAHGGWLDWLDERGVANQTANRFMQLSKLDIPQVGEFESVQAALESVNKRARSGNGSHDNDDEWYTPPQIIAAARSAMGGIDLDPASHKVANSYVKAKRYFTAEDDGLSKPWSGRVFLNPPYSKQGGKAAFIAKLAASFDAGTVTSATVVLSYDFSASWFEPLRGRYAAICLLRGRVQFYKETPDDGQNPALGTSLVYLGPDVGRFAQASRALGDVVMPESLPGRAQQA